MKLSDVYRKAAKNIESGVGPYFSCWNINWTASNGAETTGHISWDENDPRVWYERRMTNGMTFLTSDERILALCFAAAMAESEGK